MSTAAPATGKKEGAHQLLKHSTCRDVSLGFIAAHLGKNVVVLFISGRCLLQTLYLVIRFVLFGKKAL